MNDNEINGKISMAFLLLDRKETIERMEEMGGIEKMVTMARNDQEG
jgi:hypothetical protein